MNDFEICKKCGSLVGFNSRFQSYVCTQCRVINIEKLQNSKRLEISYYDPGVITGDMIRKFREEHNMTKVCLSHILMVDCKTVAKWESGKRKIRGSSAILFSLIKNDKDLLNKLYIVEYKE